MYIKLQGDCLHKFKEIYVLNGPLNGHSADAILVSDNNISPNSAHTLMQPERPRRRRMFLGKSIGRVDEVSELLAPVHQVF